MTKPATDCRYLRREELHCAPLLSAYSARRQQEVHGNCAYRFTYTFQNDKVDFIAPNMAGRIGNVGEGGAGSTDQLITGRRLPPGPVGAVGQGVQPHLTILGLKALLCLSRLAQTDSDAVERDVPRFALTGTVTGVDAGAKVDSRDTSWLGFSRPPEGQAEREQKEESQNISHGKNSFPI